MHTNTLGEEIHVSMGADIWSDIAISQGKPRIAGNHQKVETGKKGFLPRPFKGNITLLTT